MQNIKPNLRKHFLHIRGKIDEHQEKQAAIAAADNFVKNIPTKATNIIALYYPVNNEISTLPLVDKLLLKQNRHFCLPVIANKNSPLKFYPWNLNDKLISNVLYPQILEPGQSQTPVIPDIIVVPLVAFDDKCNRLGYGGGFYDRTIAQLASSNKTITTIGYAYESQKSLTLLPRDKHDMSLDFVVTESKVYVRRTK